MWQHVFKPSRRVKGKRRSSKFYKGRYKLVTGEKPTEIALKTRDKDVALERLRELVRQKQNEQAGIVAPRSLREGAARPLADHLRDFVADLKARGARAKYAYNVDHLCRRVFGDCCWVHANDVTTDGFVTWRAGIADKLAAKTLNEYLDSLNALLNWMQRHRRLQINPLREVRKVETRGKQKRVRRALTDEEFGRLLAVAGPRRVVYLAAWLTGLRRGELQALRWGDAHLEGDAPFLLVRAATTKNHEAEVVEVRDDLATELQTIRPADASPSSPVFAVPQMGRAGRELVPGTFRADLAAAQIAEKDDQGQVVDFHSLRHKLCTDLHRANVSKRRAMKIMRHSDSSLTEVVYLDEDRLDTREALSKLARYDTQKDTQTSGDRRQSVSRGGRSKKSTGSENRQQNQADRAPVATDGTICHKSLKTRQVGLEPTENRGGRGRKRGTTHKSAHTDSDLAAIIDAWPELSSSARRAIVALVREVRHA